MSVNVFSTKVLIEDMTAILICSSEPRQGEAVCRGKAVSSFLSFCKTMSIGPAPGIDPATSCFAVKRSNNWANPVADIVPLVLSIGQ